MQATIVFFLRPDLQLADRQDKLVVNPDACALLVKNIN